MAVHTLSDLVFHLRRNTAGRADLITVRRGARRETLSATDFLHQVHSLALALEARGVERGTRVAIFSENRPEWHVADFACHLIGAVTVPLLPTLRSDRLGFVLRNSSSRWVFYSDRAKRDLLTTLASTLTSPPEAVAFDGDAAFPAGTSITRMMGEGAARLGEVPIGRFRDRAEEDDPASILYPDDGVKDPRGIVLSHRNLIAGMLACDELFGIGSDDLAASFLPLAYGLQRTIDHLCLYRRGAILHAPSLDDLPAALRAEHPTLLVASASFYQRLHREIVDPTRDASATRQRLLRWALAVGRRHAAASRSGFVGPLLAAERWLARLLVFRRVNERVGGRLRLALCGGERLPLAASEFFEAIGLPACESYAPAETSPILASNAPGRYRPGSVGRALSAVELRVGANGEIEVRGPGVPKGFWGDPEASAETFTESGWLRTGDVATLDPDGYLFLAPMASPRDDLPAHDESGRRATMRQAGDDPDA